MSEAGAPPVGYSLSRRLWEAALPEVYTSLHHPFVRALADGSLSRRGSRDTCAQRALVLVSHRLAVLCTSGSAPGLPGNGWRWQAWGVHPAPLPELLRSSSAVRGELACLHRHLIANVHWFRLRRHKRAQRAVAWRAALMWSACSRIACGKEVPDSRVSALAV